MLFLPPLRERSLSPVPRWVPSHRRQLSSNFSNVNPSHRQQFSLNCSSAGLFHAVQSFGNSLLHRGSPTGLVTSPARKPPAWAPLFIGSQVPARTLLQHGFPMGSVHSLLSGILLLQGVSPPWAACGSLHPPWICTDYRGKAASPWSAPQPAEESWLWHLEHVLASFSTDLMSAELFLSHVLIPLFSGPNYICTIFFFPF